MATKKKLFRRMLDKIRNTFREVQPVERYERICEGHRIGDQFKLGSSVFEVIKVKNHKDMVIRLQAQKVTYNKPSQLKGSA